MARWLVGALLAVLAGQSLAARPLDTDQRGQIHVAQAPPKWPDVYEVEYNLILPYLDTLQPGGFRYPVHVWWDGPNQRYRFDVYGGLDSTGWDINKGINWNLYPRIKEVACDYSNGTVGPTSAAGTGTTATRAKQLLQALGLGDGASSTPLPDISDWSYAGTAQVGNAEAVVWQFAVRHGEKTAQYTFYTAQNGWPLRFYMMGLNLLTGSHFDEYVVEFTRFKPGPIAPAVFALPPACQGDMSQRQQQQQQQQEEQQGVTARVGALLPAALMGASSSSSSSGNSLLSDLRSRAASAFADNAAFVDEHNQRLQRQQQQQQQQQQDKNGAVGSSEPASAPTPYTPTYTLSLNHFAHLTHEQWAATMLGLGGQTDSQEESSQPKGGLTSTSTSTTTRSSKAGGTPYQRVLSDGELPANVDWRGSGADGPGVKDQVSCGSCWAFSAVGALQGAWFQATGQSLSFSEQQLVDCSWDYGNNGCAGGWVEPAISYVVDGGGVAQEADYPYMGQNTFCRGPTASPTPSPPSSLSSTAAAPPPVVLSGHFSGYQNVPSRDEAALMEALALHGPVAVVMNAARPPFKFYSEGVYFNPECGTDPDSMDHAVLLVGYGTTPEGVDYWLIKNSWSKYWGMDGYARIARKVNDCGVTTDPVLAVVNATAAAAARAQVSASV